MIIAQVELLYYHSETEYGTRGDGIDRNLLNEMLEHYRNLGVDAYRKYNSGLIEWKLNDHWYDDFQLDRIMRLRAFL